MAHFFNPPPVFTGGAQPYGQKELPPAITAVPVNNPPFSQSGRLAYTQSVVLSWQPPPPEPLQGRRQPTEQRKLPPSITAVPVNNPPFGQRSAVVANLIVQYWQPGPPIPWKPRVIGPLGVSASGSVLHPNRISLSIGLRIS